MTQDDKQLLFKDLCARLPYGAICHTPKGDGHLCSIEQTIFGTEYGLNINPVKRDYFNDSETDEQIVKPYLRSMSSMTEEERTELRKFCKTQPQILEDIGVVGKVNSIAVIDFLNSHHFDFRNLIEKGLAIDCTGLNIY